MQKSEFKAEASRQFVSVLSVVLATPTTPVWCSYISPFISLHNLVDVESRILLNGQQLNFYNFGVFTNILLLWLPLAEAVQELDLYFFTLIQTYFTKYKKS